jgi:hypothetical protein
MTCRVKKRRMRPLYPDVFLIHAGGPWGCHAAFDFMPDHKEVFATADPAELLRVVNNLGITHLAIPERPRRSVQHRFKEPEAAHDRIKQCFVYGPAGTVTVPQVRIEVNPAAPVLGNYESTLFPKTLVDMLDTMAAAPELRVTTPDEIAIWQKTTRKRLQESSEQHPSHQRGVQRIARARQENAITEELRRVDVAAALEMLG